jgi:hypothetical protein
MDLQGLHKDHSLREDIQGMIHKNLPDSQLWEVVKQVLISLSITLRDITNSHHLQDRA